VTARTPAAPPELRGYTYLRLLGGTVIGGPVGWAVAPGVTSDLEDRITDLGAAVGSVAYDGGGAVVDFCGDVLDGGGELLGDIDEDAEELWEDLRPW
jgi:hypothetical protein